MEILRKLIKTLLRMAIFQQTSYEITFFHTGKLNTENVQNQ